MNIAPYPTEFTDGHVIVTSEILSGRGFDVRAGLEAADVAEITAISQADSIREFCPNDMSRFGDMDKAAAWLAKGRGMFQLRTIGTNALAGYGWTGLEKNEHVPQGETTFAIRLAPEFAGQRLAVPFARSILLGSAALYGSKSVWLETWQSNQAAVRIYQKNGAVLVAEVPSERATLTTDSGKIADTRLFMRFPQTFPVDR